MTFVELDFSYNNSVLAPLADLEPPKDKNTLDVKLADLPESMALPIGSMYKALFNKQASDDLVVFRLVFKDGRVPKLYSPAIYKKDDKLAMRWGNDILELAIGKSTLEAETIAKTDFNFNFTDQRIGKYEESVLEFVLTDYEGYDEVVMPFVVKRASYEEPFDSAKAKQLFKKGQSAELCELIAELKTGTGGSVSGDVYGNDVLPQGVDITIIRAVPRTTQYGQNYILTAQANPEIGLKTDTNFWGFSKIKQKLNKGAVIDAKHPATLNFVKTVNDAGDTRYNMKFDVHWLETEDTLKLTNLLSNWS